MSIAFDNGREVVNFEGMRVEKDVLDIIGRIREYNDKLEVFYLDPERADINDAPWVVAELCPDGLYRRVLEVWQLDGSVLERVQAADTHRIDVLGSLEKQEFKVRSERERRFKDESAEMQDIMKTILNSRQTQFTFHSPTTGELVTLDEDYGIVKRDNTRVKGD